VCGIVGALVLGESPFRVTEPYLVRMRDVMAHRGPDGVGSWVAEDGRVGLAFRRLAIIDLSPKANQPMSTLDGRLRVVFNGEIYNHAELRRELEEIRPRQWQTDHADTEVILQAFCEWGIDAIHRFRGMFAIGLWDAATRELWLIRDRIGVKPLYYSIHDGRLVFASEIKGLLEDPQQARAIDEQSLYHYLSFLTTPAPRTMFAGINKLAGGSWLRVGPTGEVKVERYWDVWDHTTPLTEASDADIASQLLAELRTSVRLRKVSDVPVGVFLSGGLDSGTNAVLFSEGETRPVRTFSIGYRGDYPSYRNEFSHARRVAQMVGADHHERVLDVSELISFLPRMVHLQDEPLADPVCVPVYYVSELARQHGVIVCQVGEGADELFCGYPSWRTLLDLQNLDRRPVPRGLKRGIALAARAAGLGHRREYELLRRANANEPVFWSGADAMTDLQKRRVLGSRLRRELDGLTSFDAIRPIWERFQAKAWERSVLNWMTFVDLNLRLPELLLMRVDKMAMGVSLEGRVPFLDHRFVELSMSIPEAVKTRNGTLKYILKKAVRGLLPDDLIDRPKQGFGVPIQEWLIGGLGPVVRRELSAFSEATDLFDRGEVLRLIDDHETLSVWVLLNLALWWKHFIAREELELAA
jgi:asparagine synthase (glutamine-hydrolysing)